MSDIKPCPFCGYSDVDVVVEDDHFGRCAKVSCQICGATVHGVGILIPEDAPEADLIASAMEAWNHREAARRRRQG